MSRGLSKCGNLSKRAGQWVTAREGMAQILLLRSVEPLWILHLAARSRSFAAQCGALGLQDFPPTLACGPRRRLTRREQVGLVQTATLRGLGSISRRSPASLLVSAGFLNTTALATGNPLTVQSATRGALCRVRGPGHTPVSGF
jgi:hypothetical protein